MAKEIKNHWVLRNLIGAAAFILVLVTVISIILNAATHHGQVIAVPDFSNLSVEEARALAGQSDMRVDVTDSVFVRKMARGAVFSQNPKAGARVKTGRKIRLTINATVPKKVTMPNLVGYTTRQAKAELSSKGLYLGKLIYVSDIATNNVLKQLYRNSEIKPGTSIESGAEITLVAGLNSENDKTMVPDVKGLKYMRAVDAVQDNSLNIGKLAFDKSVTNYADSVNAVVYRQSPEASRAEVTMGTEVTLYLTVDPERIPE